MSRKTFFVSLSLLFLFALPTIPSKAKNTHSERTIASYAHYLNIPGAKPVGADTCTGCHEVVAKNFGHAFHAQQGVACEDCHGAGSLHVEGGGDVNKIVAFAKRFPEDANGACLSCHARDEKARHWISGAHAANHVRCTDCHQIHQAALHSESRGRASFDHSTSGARMVASVSPETNAIIRPMWQTNEACLKCQPTEGAQLSMPFHHPLREGKMSCVDCHDPHGGPAGNNLITANKNELCLNCHAQYRGPFAYQHPPVTENCLICHNVHGSPNTNLLNVSEPALCLQCHAGHHNGDSLPLPDRCTNCHGSIHGTDVPTPSGGSRFIDKGPSEPQLRAGNIAPISVPGSLPYSTAVVTPHAVSAHMTALSTGAAGGALGLLSSAFTAPLSSTNLPGGPSFPGSTDIETSGYSGISFTPGAYRFVDGSGFLGRVGEYDSLSQSAGADLSAAYVSSTNKLTVVSRANVQTGADYSAATQLTAGEWLQVGLFIRSFVQQQDHYNFYAFPVLDAGSGNTTTDLIPGQSVFGITQRLGSAYARFKVPKLPVHLFVKGNWRAQAGSTQLAYLDENTVPLSQQECGFQCHFQSQFQPVNYTTRNVGGGAQVDLGQARVTYEHTFSSFNDRLLFPTGVFTGEFDPTVEGLSSINPPPFGPAPPFVPIANYFIDPPSSNQQSTDSLRLNWNASSQLAFNGQVSYTRLHDLFTHYPQNSFDTDNTLVWRPIDPLRLTLDYHQQNLINNFTPFYSMYGNVSYHNHWEGLRLDYTLLKGFNVEAYYKRSGITRSNAVLWEQTAQNAFGIPSQIYSIDNTDLLKVVPSSFGNTTGLALRYHHNSWSARTGYEWTGTHDPGYLTVPQSNNRAFASVWFTPVNWLVLSNDFNAIVQNAFPAISLLRPDGTGLSGDFQRRNRFYYETLDATLRPLPDLTLGLGYSYQQNNLTTYMAFQNDSGVGYVVNEPAVPYRQITQAYWADTNYTYRRRLGMNLRVTYNSSRSGFRPDVNPADAAKLGNACLLNGSCGAFDPDGLFAPALGNVQFASTQISEVIVPQWIGEGKLYYVFPRKVEGGFVFYYGSYRDYFNPDLNGVLRTFTLYVGKSW